MSKVNNYRLGVAFLVVQPLVSKPGSLGQQKKTHEFICVAFDAAIAQNLLREEDARAAKKIIQTRIYPNGTVNGWAKDHGHFTREGVTFDEEFDAMQEFRLRWLKELEREFFCKQD